MKRILLVIPLAFGLAACDTQPTSTAYGAGVGALAGAALSSKDDRAKGALIGAAAGAVAGNYIGRTQSGQCIYQRGDGSRYTAACP